MLFSIFLHRLTLMVVITADWKGRLIVSIMLAGGEHENPHSPSLVFVLPREGSVRWDRGFSPRACDHVWRTTTSRQPTSEGRMPHAHAVV